VGKRPGWRTITSARPIGRGDEGRLALIKGEQKLTVPQSVAPYATLAKRKDDLRDGFVAQTYPDSQNLFTLGHAAVYPAGSWEILGFNGRAKFMTGVIATPVLNTSDTFCNSDHTDFAMGMNAKSADPVFQTIRIRLFDNHDQAAA
jgi:raffinose/stachyose/melibiose transport system substrate-binding protein